MNKEASGDTGEEFRGKQNNNRTVMSSIYFFISYLKHVFITQFDCGFYTM